MMNPGWSRSACVYVCLVFTTIVAYSQIVGHDFISFDDPYYVYENKHVITGLSWRNIHWAFTTGEQSNWHPVTWMSHMLDAQLFGETRPGCHHATNCLLHLVNTLLTFYLFQKMTGAFWRPAFVAAIFSLHPLHVESVAWISERKDVLSTAFWLLSIVCYVRYAIRFRIRWYLLAIACLALGLMSKPMLVTAPFVFLLLDYWPLRRLSFRPATGQSPEPTVYPQRTLRWLILEKLPMLLLTVTSSVITYSVHSHGHGIGTAAWSDRWPTVVVTYVRYLRKSIWPVNLSVLYPEPIEPWTRWQVLGAAGILMVLTAIVLIFRNKRYLAVGWMWFLGTLVPVIGIVQIGKHAMADRYMYVPLTGLVVMLAWAGADMFRRSKLGRNAIGVTAAVIVIACFCLTSIQVGRWRNSFVLFGHALEVTEGNYVIHNNLGVALQCENRILEALQQYQRAVSIRPGYFLGNKNLALVFASRGRSDEAIVHFHRALQAEPDDMELRNGLANILASQGDVEGAIRHYQHVVEVHRRAPEAHYNLGLMMHRRGRIKEAIVHYREALTTNPDLPAAHNNLGMALRTQGNLSEAIAHFQKALKVQPKHKMARHNLGKTREMQQQAQPK